MKQTATKSLLGPRRLTLIGWAICFLLLIIGFLAVHLTRPFDSDDVAQQVIMQTWHVGRSMVDLPADTFIIKLPLYALLDRLGTSLSIAVGTAIFFGLLGIALIGWSLTVLSQQPKLKNSLFLLPLIWVLSLGLALYTVLINPNSRNLEIGLGFALLALIQLLTQQVTSRGERYNWLLIGIGSVVVGLFWYSDPFFLYLLGLPLLIFLTGWLYFDGVGQRRLSIVCSLLGSIFMMVLWKKMFSLLGFHVHNQPATFVSFDRLGFNTHLFVQNLLTLFDATIFGKSALSLAALRAIGNGLLLLSIFVAPFIVPRHNRQSSPWLYFWLWQPWVSVGFFILSTTPVDAGSTRYLILIPFYGVVSLLVLVSSLQSQKWKSAVIGLMVIAASLNSAALLASLRGPHAQPNAKNKAVIAAIRQLNLDKGYADYWSGPINTYLSGGQIHFIQTICTPEKLVRPHYWLLDEQLLEQTASQSFYLFESDKAAQSGCTEERILTQLGLPDRTIAVDPTTQIFVYDRDITSSIIAEPS